VQVLPHVITAKTKKIEPRLVTGLVGLIKTLVQMCPEDFGKQ